MPLERAAALATVRNPPDCFVGRERYLDLLQTELARRRAVSLCGPAGVGKTRLACFFGEQAAKSYPDGAHVVDASGVCEPGALARRMGATLSVTGPDGCGVGEIAKALGKARCLMVLDDCDLFGDACRTWVADLLDAAAELRILATSRRAAILDGSSTVTLPPLSAPEDHEHPDMSWAARSEAVQLFIERARVASVEFELTDENCAAVARLCRRLDGLPLAIELAASWVRALSVDEILERLDREPGFLTRRRDHVPAAARDFAGVAEDGFARCREEERQLWIRLSVFDGTFDLGAAEAVCGDTRFPEDRVVELLASLIDQSIVVAEVGEPVSRYRLLWPMREFGADRLRCSNRGEEIRDAHARWYAQLLRCSSGNWLGPDQQAWMKRLRAEHRSIVAAISLRASDPRTVDTALEMASDLWLYWLTSGHLAEGCAVLNEALAAPAADSTSPMRARALLTAAYIRIVQGRVRDAEALVVAARRIAIAEAPLEAAFEVHVRAMLELAHGRAQAASAGLERAIDGYSDLPGNKAKLLSFDALGLATFLAATRGEHDTVRDYELRGLLISGERQDRVLRGYIDYSAAVALFVRGDVAEAARRARSAIRETLDELLMAHCLELLAWCSFRERDSERAAILLGAVDRRWHRIGGRLSGFEEVLPFRDDTFRRCRSALGREAFASAYASGASLPRAETQRYAMLEEVASVLSDDPLTRREREVSGLVARGMTNREIAEALTISQRTAESHLDHILTKLAMTNRTQLAAWVASRQGAGLEQHA